MEIGSQRRLRWKKTSKYLIEVKSVKTEIPQLVISTCATAKMQVQGNVVTVQQKVGEELCDLSCVVTPSVGIRPRIRGMLSSHLSKYIGGKEAERTDLYVLLKHICRTPQRMNVIQYILRLYFGREIVQLPLTQFLTSTGFTTKVGTFLRWQAPTNDDAYRCLQWSLEDLDVQEHSFVVSMYGPIAKLGAPWRPYILPLRPQDLRLINLFVSKGREMVHGSLQRHVGTQATILGRRFIIWLAHREVDE